MSEDPREKRFAEMAAQFPSSAMAHFSLGGFYLEGRRYQEAIKSLEEAMKLEPTYCAALVELGDAYLGAGERSKALKTYDDAKAVAISQKHLNLAEEIERKKAQV